MCFVEGVVAVILKLFKFSWPDLLTIEHHTPTPEAIRYDKTEGQWYTHDGVDVKETQSRKGTLEYLTNKFCNMCLACCLCTCTFTCDWI